MSTVAFASFRMEPNYMIAGSAAGTAAALAASARQAAQAVDTKALQDALLAQGQILAAN